MRRRKKLSSDPVTVEIDSQHPDGYGLASDERYGIVGALPGETVTAMPFARKKRRIFCRPEAISQNSADRVEPRCAASNYCGGCSLQHMSSESQIRFKQQQVQLEFEQCPPQAWLEPITADNYHYRSKARLGVKFVDKKGKVLVGFREKMKPYIVEIENCPILSEPVSNLIVPLAELVGGFEQPRSIPQIEVAIGDQDAALVFRHLEPLSVKDQEKLSAFGERHQIDIYLQPDKLTSVWKLFPADGNDRLLYEIDDNLRISMHPMDFAQVNSAINRKMVDRAIELLEPQPEDHILDAFCGIGNFSLALARRASSVLGLENCAASVLRARENAQLNGLTNTRFEEMDLFIEENTRLDLRPVTKVLVDPPRTGALELCKKLANSDVERVVYVSCNPNTLARDAKILVEKGYQLRRLGLIDMFPHTTHVESIALLTRQ